MRNSKLTNYLRYILWPTFLLIVWFSFYYGLSFYGLANNNEGLYAEIAREMYTSHQYIIPTLNGVPYIEKPPLLYWLIAGSFHLWHIGEFAARFVPATCGAILCLSLVFFSQQINRLREGLLAGLILSTSLGFVLISRIVFFDMLLTTLFSLSLMSYYLAWFFARVENYNPKIFQFTLRKFKSLWFIRLGYGFLGLAVLTKSLVALALIPSIMCAFLLCTKTWRAYWKLFFDPLGIFIFLIIILPWHILATLQHPHFLQDFFINEQFMRFLDKRVPHDYYTGPLYYYLPRIMLYLLPWSLLLPLLGLKKYRQHLSKDPIRIFAWLWVLIPLIFFSLSKAKANYYMVISCPALALLLSKAIYSDILNKQRIKLWSSIIGVGVVFSMSSIAFATTIAKNYEDKFSAKNLVLSLQQRADIDQSRIFIYQEFEKISSLAFYLETPLKIIDSKSKDLWYGAPFDKNHTFFTMNTFDTTFENKNCYVILNKKKLPEFYERIEHCQFYPTIRSGEWIALKNNRKN